MRFGDIPCNLNGMSNGYAVDLSVLPAFLAAVVLVCVAPGPDMAYVVATGIAAGRAAVTRGALGVTTGVVVYAVAVAAGLGAVVARYPAVLVALQVLGTLYLVYLARRTFREAADVQLVDPQDGDHTNWFRRGLIVNLSNPKVLLFFLAFLPGFLGRAGSPTLQLLMLGVLFQIIGLVVDLAIGWSAGAFRATVLARPAMLRGMTYTSAAVFLVLALVVGVDAVTTLLGWRG